MVPLRPSSERILIVRAPGARDRHGCHSTPFHRARSASKECTWPLPSHPSEAARCASTGIVPATPPRFSILLKRLDHQLQMHTRILQIGMGIVQVIQTLAPVHLEAAPSPDIPDRSGSHTR